MKHWIAAIALLVSTQAQAVTLWQNISSGMTEKKLRKARPGITEIRQADWYKWPNGCTLRDRNRLGTSWGDGLSVCYVMVNGRVAAVAWNRDAPPGDNNMYEYEQELTAKYGQPVSKSCRKVATAYRCDREWQSAGVSIKLTSLMFYTSGADLHVRYEALPDRASGH